MFNLVQSLKTLFLYTQSEKDTVEVYGRNFCSLWETVEVFGGLPGLHKGLVNNVLKEKNISSPTSDQRKAVDESTCEVVKAALLISSRLAEVRKAQGGAG